jgi:predicted sugar kinase
MNIEPGFNDIHIDLGRINGTIGLTIDGKSYAIGFSMTVEEAERAATDDISFPITITEL